VAPKKKRGVKRSAIRKILLLRLKGKVRRKEKYSHLRGGEDALRGVRFPRKDPLSGLGQIIAKIFRGR